MRRGSIATWLAGVTAGLNPFRSFTFVSATGLAALAAWVWLRRSSGSEGEAVFPFYGLIAASYAGGYLVGRAFRHVLRAIVSATAIVLSGVVLLQCVRMDTADAERAVESGSMWMRAKATRVKDYLLHLLPAGPAAGGGVFAGGRRWRREAGEARAEGSGR
jgi:hypothetical protein